MLPHDMGDKAGRGERTLLHPDRLVLLFRRAGWLARTACLLLFAVTLVGAWLAFASFTLTEGPYPDQPPATVRLDCPPAVIAAFAGRGRISSPAEVLAAAHDVLCEDGGRRRALIGGLLLLGGVVNAAAVLEWARVGRRARRRRAR
jgi:hypothetical protein